MIITKGDLCVVSNPWGAVGHACDPSVWQKLGSGNYYVRTLFSIKNGEIIIVLESSSADVLAMTTMGIVVIARAYISNEF